jgi:hypothetical protein
MGLPKERIRAQAANALFVERNPRFIKAFTVAGIPNFHSPPQ